jgi:hypothetical protein
MHFFRDCGRGLVAPTVGSSVLVRQTGRSSCTNVHSGSPRGGYSGFALALRASRWLLSPLRSGSLQLLPWMAYKPVLQEQKQITKKLLFLEAPYAGL